MRNALRYWFVAYWLIFAVRAFQAGRRPQFLSVLDFDRPLSYPWAAVLWLWLGLAVLVLCLRAIVRTGANWRPVGRWAGTILYTLLLLSFLPGIIGDGPGYGYVLVDFAIVTLFVLLYSALRAVVLKAVHEHTT